MPAISRIRIVNFSYNNGRRRIADQTFSMYFDGKPQDTLLNLENGGGKSVLVQLIMQPVLPLVAMNGRKIDGYFSKTGDPAYILLEWKLDESEDFLTTGIALCPGENVEEGGGNMRYFTFTTQYGRYGNEEYDIANLSLSEQNGRQFRFVTYRASMELIKSLQKRFPAKVHYYHSDEVNDYYSELREFGISREEWQRVVAPINNHEGGVKDLFENYKTTDKLLDEMLISTIDRAISGMTGDSDASLPQMILHYARKTVDNEENLILKKQMQQFSEELTKCREPANELWKLSDSWNHAIGEIYGFSRCLKAETQKQYEIQKQLQTEQQQAQDAIRRLVLEQASDEWYKAHENLLKAQKQKGICSEKKDAAQHALEENRRNQNIMDAARIYRSICRLKNRAEGIRANIEANESNTDIRKQFNGLRYSIYVKASEEHGALSRQTGALEEKCSEYEKHIGEMQNQKISAQEECEKCRRRAAVLNDRLTVFQTDTEKLFQLLALDLLPNILGEYLPEEVEKAKKYLQKGVSDAEDLILACEGNFKLLQAEQTKYSEGKTAIAVRESDLKHQLETLDGRMSLYRDSEQKADAVLKQYDLAANAKFYPEQRNILHEKLMQFHAAGRDAERKHETAAKQLAALREGSLHIPGKLLKGLDELDVSYMTGETWLRQRENQRSRMLELFPEFPYCIILTADDFEKVRSKLKDLWLPCLGCFVSYDTLERLLKDGKPFSTGELLTLSRYEKKSLCMRDEFEKELNESCKNYASQEEYYARRKKQMGDDIRFLDSFSYDKDYFSKLCRQKAQIGSCLQDAVRQKKTIAEKDRKVSADINGNRRKQAELNDMLHAARESMVKFTDWCSKKDMAFRT